MPTPLTTDEKAHAIADAFRPLAEAAARMVAAVNESRCGKVLRAGRAGTFAPGETGGPILKGKDHG